MNHCSTIEKMLKLSAGDRDRAGKVVARSLYRILRRNGFSQGEVMAVAGHLLDGVILDMKQGIDDHVQTAPVDLPEIVKESLEVA